MTASFQNILVATDFSEQSNNAIKTAIALCKQHGAVLHLLHVIENRYIVSSDEAGISSRAIVNEIDQDSRSRLYGVYESILRNHAIRVQIHMPTGIPFDEICKAADEMPIDLIVIGTHGTSGVREVFMGTTTYNVLKNSTKPVLTIPENFDILEFKKILFPVRPITGVKAKFKFVQSFLNKQAAAIHISSLYLKGEKDQTFEDADELKEIISYMNAAGIPGDLEIFECENFAAKVISLSDLLLVDLIVINATLAYKWTQFFVSSYTQQIVNVAKMPVLSFREAVNIPEKERKEKELKKYWPGQVSLAGM